MIESGLKGEVLNSNVDPSAKCGKRDNSFLWRDNDNVLRKTLDFKGAGRIGHG